MTSKGKTSVPRTGRTVPASSLVAATTSLSTTFCVASKKGTNNWGSCQQRGSCRGDLPNLGGDGVRDNREGLTQSVSATLEHAAMRARRLKVDRRVLQGLSTRLQARVSVPIAFWKSEGAEKASSSLLRHVFQLWFSSTALVPAKNTKQREAVAPEDEAQIGGDVLEECSLVVVDVEIGPGREGFQSMHQALAYFLHTSGLPWLQNLQTQEGFDTNVSENTPLGRTTSAGADSGR